MSDATPAVPSFPAAAPRKVLHDLASIATIGDWPERPYPSAAVGNRNGNYAVLIRQSVLNDVAHHGIATMDVEVCGVLVGNVYRDADGAYLHVEHVIEGNHATGQAAQVTFTAETWSHIQDQMEQKYPDLKILGWYHTHPGYGIFLSRMDVFLHENFFNLAWQIALVFDPKAGADGLFIWRDGQLTRQSFAIEPDVEADMHLAAASPGVAGDNAGGMAPGTVLEFSARLQAIETRQRWTTAFLALLGVIALGWPVALFVLGPAFRASVNAATPHASNDTLPPAAEAYPTTSLALPPATQPLAGTP